MRRTLPARRLILLAGHSESTTEALRAFIDRSGLKPSQIAWPTRPGNSADLLGQDYALVVFDAWQGLDPDSFGRLSGLVQAGGALVVICPALKDWPHTPDPAEARLIPYPLSQGSANRHYLERWLRLLAQRPEIEIVESEQLATISVLKVVEPDCPSDHACTEDQQHGIDAVIKTTLGQRRRPAVISADRGRGKSAALGLAAGRLLQRGQAGRVIVTASGFAQAGNIFKHARAVLPDAGWSETDKKLSHGNSELVYVAAENLLRSPLACDLLLVDEAATLGVARLRQLLKAYPRLALATTEHGYEGSGRGFALKFRQLVQEHCRGHHPVRLNTPIRWAENDPLETWSNELLLLNLPRTDAANSPEIRLDSLQLRPVSQQELVKDENLLKKVFCLLVDAHYQTRPVDARYLLDAPNSLLYIAEQAGQLLGLVWLMREGGLDDATAIDVVCGRRRPQGHLVPQTLAAHLGLENAAMCNCHRVQRIAVQPEVQGRGVGSWMLNKLEQSIDSDCDYLATSFGADKRLVRFWQRAGYQAVRVSDRLRATSGLHSALMIKPRSKAGLDLLEQAGEAYLDQYPEQLTGSLSQLEPDLVLALSTQKPVHRPLTPQKLKSAVLFAWADRPFSSCLGAIKTLAQIALGDESIVYTDNRARGLLIARLLQNRSWSDCAELFDLNGQAECTSLLRKVAGEILEQYCERADIDELRLKYHLGN